jgi:hypothetical protein
MKGRNRPRMFTLDVWDRLRKIGVNGPKVLPSDLVFIGLRDFRAEKRSHHRGAPHQGDHREGPARRKVPKAATVAETLAHLSTVRQAST